jgi:hypothetical protein
MCAPLPSLSNDHIEIILSIVGFFITCMGVYLALVTWEVSMLLNSMLKYNPTVEPHNFDAQFFARRLTNLPLWLARTIFVTAILREKGQETMSHWMDAFEAEYKSLKESRKHLYKRGYYKR